MFHHNIEKNSSLTLYKNESNKNKIQSINNICDMIHSFHGIVGMTVTKSIPIRIIDTDYICKLENGIN